jgi:hypothetical protein
MIAHRERPAKKRGIKLAVQLVVSNGGVKRFPIISALACPTFALRPFEF